MTCKITRPDPQELFNRIRDMFSVNVLGGAPVIPESNEWYVVGNDYAMQEQFYSLADQMWRETNPETACCENLQIMAARNGVYPKPAAFSQGYARLRGVAGSALPSRIEIATAIGSFESTGNMPTVIGSDGTAIIQIKALIPGPQGNSAGQVTTGTLTTSIPGVETEVEICGGYTCGGAEAETCEAFRSRYLERLAYKPRATSAWIKEQIMSWPCVTRVCERAGSCCQCGPDDECGCLSCSDRLEFYVLFDDSFACGIPPPQVIIDVRNWLFGERQGFGEGIVEIGICGNVYAPIALPVDVYIDIEGCPTSSQKQAIEANIRDLFRTICPSMILRQRQVELIVAEVIGAQYNVDVRFDVFEAPRSQVYVTECGDLEPECDYLPCVQSIIFTGGGATGDTCE